MIKKLVLTTILLVLILSAFLVPRATSIAHPASPTYQNLAEAGTASATEITIVAPAGFSAGDLFLAFITKDDDVLIDEHGDWTTLHRVTSGTGCAIYCAWRIAQTGDTNWTWTGDSEAYYGAILRFTGHDPMTSINISDVAVGNDATPTAPDVLTTRNDCMIFRGFGADDDDVPYTSPGSPFVEVFNDSYTTTGATGGYEPQISAGQTGTGIFGMDADEEWGAVTVAIQPPLGEEEGYFGPLVDGEDPRDPDLVYLDVRPHLDHTEIVGRGAPTQVYIGIFTGFSLPIWSDPVNLNEELYFNICVPGRWDEEHDIVIEVISALSNAGEQGNTYQLDLAWEKVTPNVEVVPVSFHSVSAQRYNLSNLQYYCYRDYFVVDFDAPIADPIIREDDFALRLRLGQIGGQYTDLDGELIILHVGVLFPRGDLLGDPPDFDDYITEAEMEEVGIQFEVFNTILTGWAVYFLIFFGLLFILGLSGLAFWRWSALLFMLVGGASIIFGFYWYDAFTTNLGLALGLMMATYGLVCISLAFRCMFWMRKEKDTED